MKISVKKYETKGEKNRREEIYNFPGWYLIVTPPLGNGLSFCVLYNPKNELIAKANRPMSLEGRMSYARDYVREYSQNEK